jgi:LysM repeat protein
MEALDNKTEVKIWKSKKALVTYTKESGKIFPKAAAKNGGPVKELLAQIY